MHQDGTWTEAALAALPQKNGFRLRGLEMTRLETFADAAFAFAVTMLVISIDIIPGNLEELIVALKGVPAFAASFASIGVIWAGHNSWSRRYGMDDGPTTLLTLMLIFIMLVYLYPLKLVFSALFGWVSGGWFPSEFEVNSAQELAGLFVIYGVGFAAISTVIGLLYGHAARNVDALRLNELERLATRSEVMGWRIMTATGVLSALFALLVPGDFKAFAGFVYFLLPVAMPINAIYFDKRMAPLRNQA